MSKLLLALQFWDGDKAAAMDLARLISDLEQSHCEYADFLFVSRFDCQHDTGIIKYLSRKFNTFSLTSKRRGVGWPAGCNDLFLSTVEWVYHMSKSKKIPDYNAILTFEADACPLQRDWINILRIRWNELLSKKPVVIAGDLTPNPDWHVNGNCLVNADRKSLHWLMQTLGRCPGGAGWDYFFRKTFEKKGWGAIPGIWSEYGVPTFPAERWDHVTKTQGVILHHGVKDGSLRSLVRQKLLAGDGTMLAKPYVNPSLEEQKNAALAFLRIHSPELLK